MGVHPADDAPLQHGGVGSAQGTPELHHPVAGLPELDVPVLFGRAGVAQREGVQFGNPAVDHPG